MTIKRRELLKKLSGGALGLGIAMGGSMLFFLDGESNSRDFDNLHTYGNCQGALLRPPGAVEESHFLSACIGCFQCAEACSIQAIRFIKSLGNPLANTPFVIPQEKGCNLCMECTRVCPTGALKKISDDRTSVQRKVKMGVAVVDELTCRAYNNRAICGACYLACPFSNEAIKVKGSCFKPVVNNEKCVGCGLCEEACPQETKSIRVKRL
ncbi:MAG: 4Fe-4S dicluster domain-containing protein [Desulfobacteraceae bacterium]|jgi:MauM/NapG family ferredoxin protein